jgi:hypothetical protein
MTDTKETNVTAEHRKMLDAVDIMFKALLEEELVYDNDKSEIFSFAQKMSRIFGDECVECAAEQLANQVVGRSSYYGGKPLKYYLGWMRKAIKEKREDGRKYSVPIKDRTTQVLCCKTLDTEALNRIILSGIKTVRIVVGTFTFHPRPNIKQARIISDFYSDVLHEWTFIKETLARMGPAEQSDAFDKYDKYREKARAWSYHKSRYYEVIEDLKQSFGPDLLRS